MTDDDLTQRLDALAAANSRLWDAVDDLQDENERLRERVAELEDVLMADLDAMNYDQLTKRDKVRAIREHLLDEAGSTPNGKASMSYREVRTLFNGHPSPGHAYDLMELAGDAQGFEYERRSGDNKNRLVVNADAVKGETAFHGANKPTTSTAP